MASSLASQCRLGAVGVPGRVPHRNRSATPDGPSVYIQPCSKDRLSIPKRKRRNLTAGTAVLHRQSALSGFLVQRTSGANRGIKCAAVAGRASGDLQEKREELKSKLRTSLEGNIGNLTAEELSFIDDLAKITPDPEPAKNLEMVKGGYRLLNSTMPNVLYRGAKLTLGRATFNMYPPADLPMILHEVYNEVDGGKYYDVYQDVTLEPEGLPPLKAKILNRAEYLLEGDKRISVEFTESKVTPSEGTDLAVWKKVFGENPDLEEDGTMKKVFPKGKPGYVDILYQDESFRITKGNFGNIVIVERES